VKKGLVFLYLCLGMSCSSSEEDLQSKEESSNSSKSSQESFDDNIFPVIYRLQEKTIEGNLWTRLFIFHENGHAFIQFYLENEMIAENEVSYLVYGANDGTTKIEITEERKMFDLYKKEKVPILYGISETWRIGKENWSKQHQFSPILASVFGYYVNELAPWQSYPVEKVLPETLKELPWANCRTQPKSQHCSLPLFSQEYCFHEGDLYSDTYSKVYRGTHLAFVRDGKSLRCLFVPRESVE